MAERAKHFLTLLAAVAMAMLAACDGDGGDVGTDTSVAPDTSVGPDGDAASGCGVVGGTQACTCAGGLAGAQVCEAGGAWGACDCGGPPVDCVVSDWTEWTSCSAECGGGTQTRTRSVLVVAQNDGAACPELVESRDCNTNGCPVDCQMSAWSDWATCSAECGGGTTTRTRTITVQPANGGAACGGTSENRACNPEPCYTVRFQRLILAPGWEMAVADQNFRNGQPIVNWETGGGNNWMLRSDGKIVLENDPTYELAVADQVITQGRPLVLWRQGGNQWEVLGDGRIRLKGTLFEIAIANQSLANGTPLVIWGEGGGNYTNWKP